MVNTAHSKLSTIKQISSAHLERGKAHFEQRAWQNAWDSLNLADAECSLEPQDLERLALSAYMTGRESEYLRILERAHQAYLDSGYGRAAARCAFWSGLCLLFKGQASQASGWFCRAQRLVEYEGQDSAEQGYLLLPSIEQQLCSADAHAAYDNSLIAVKLGERFADADLLACARHLQGRALIGLGEVARGLALLDEVMIAVSLGEISALMTGLIYCSVLDTCLQVYALDRAREWTLALTRWCANQPQLLSFTSACRVHRAEVMLMQGAWSEALDEARRACSRMAQGAELQAPAAAFYQQGEVHRLRGQFREAEAAYLEASRRGFEPQPGLALLRMSQGRITDAVQALRRITTATQNSLQRTRFLPALIEILLAGNDIPEARTARDELDVLACAHNIPVLNAIAAQSSGAVELASGDAVAAMNSLRLAHQIWQAGDAPYAIARVRALLGTACRELGDTESAKLEFQAARSVFQKLGARPDLVRIEMQLRRNISLPEHGLSPRELQVLQLAAAGRTNKSIAAELCLSERTVDRHISNLLDKLNLPSRTAATAFACRHHLV